MPVPCWGLRFLSCAYRLRSSLLLARYYNIMRISQDTFFSVLVKVLLLTTVALDPVVNFLKVELGQTTTLDEGYLSLSYPLIDGILAHIEHVGNLLNTDESSFDLHCI